MGVVRINNVEIKALSTVVAADEVDVFNIEGLYGGNQKKLKRVVEATGFHKRRVSSDNMTAGDYCYQAAEDIFANTDISRDSIDAIFLVTQYPDYLGPSTACVIHGKLGLKNECAAFDVNQGCTGYIYGLWLASSLIGAGTAKRVLLLVGDTPNKCERKPLPVDTVPMFGDGGSATVLEYNPDAHPMYFDMGTDGAHFDTIIVRNGAFRNPPKQSHFEENGSYNYQSDMDKLAVVDFTIERVPPSIRSVVSAAGWELYDINAFILHQANKIIIQNIADTLKIDGEKFPSSTISKYGNLSCASIPSVACDLYAQRLKSEKMKLILCGFGIGLSWACAAIETENIYCSNILTSKE